MHITGRFIAALTVLTLGTACSGDSVTETSGDTLSEQEVLEIFTALSAVGGVVMPLGPVAAPANGPQLADIPIDESLDDTADCPNGGTLSIRGNVSGTVDDAISLFTGRPALRDGLRMLGIGALAGGVTWLIGRWLGVALA